MATTPGRVAPGVAAGPTADAAADPPPNLLSAEVFVLDEDYDLGEIILHRMERILGILRPRPEPAGGHDRLGVVVPPVSHWGIYSRPGHIVIPRPMAARLRNPGKAKTVTLVLAREMARLLGETGRR
jgi:hypothetical protein